MPSPSSNDPASLQPASLQGDLVETSVKMITCTVGLELKFVIKLLIHDNNSGDHSQKPGSRKDKSARQWENEDNICPSINWGK